MYQRLPSEEEMAATGLAPEDFASAPVEAWPDNLRPLEIFRYLRTQWHTGMNGPTGLNYQVMHHKMDRMGLTPDEYEQIEHDIQVMEVAALNCMHAKP